MIFLFFVYFLSFVLLAKQSKSIARAESVMSAAWGEGREAGHRVGKQTPRQRGRECRGVGMSWYG